MFTQDIELEEFKGKDDLLVDEFDGGISL